MAAAAAGRSAASTQQQRSFAPTTFRGPERSRPRPGPARGAITRAHTRLVSPPRDAGVPELRALLPSPPAARQRRPPLEARMSFSPRPVLLPVVCCDRGERCVFRVLCEWSWGLGSDAALLLGDRARWRGHVATVCPRVLGPGRRVRRVAAEFEADSPLLPPSLSSIFTIIVSLAEKRRSGVQGRTQCRPRVRLLRRLEPARYASWASAVSGGGGEAAVTEMPLCHVLSAKVH